MMFVVLRPGASLDEALVAAIRRRIREDCSPRHVPDEIRQIDEVPRTLSGKVLEVPVKRILSGVPVAEAASRESLANPGALDYFVELRGGAGAVRAGRPGLGAVGRAGRSTGGAVMGQGGRSRRVFARRGGQNRALRALNSVNPNSERTTARAPAVAAGG